MDMLLYLLAIIIPIIASVRVSSTYRKYQRESSTGAKSGFEVAREMLDRNGLSDIYIVETPGELTDCYDSKRKTVKLSTEVFHGTTVASLAVAAHECVHAIQDKEGYSWMRVRSAIYPVVNIGTKLAYIVLIFGFILGVLNMIYAAFVMVLLSLIFELVTLPVEFDASKRAKAYLFENNLVSPAEEIGVTKVLDAAAWTYVAAVISSLLQMLRYIAMFTRRD